MFANAELSKDFTLLNQQSKTLVRDLLEVVNVPFIPTEVEATPSGNFRGFDLGKIYVIERGTIAVRYRGRSLYVLEQGDILLPDIAGDSLQDATVSYGSESGATLQGYPGIEFMRRVLSDPEAMKLWMRLLITQVGLSARVTAGAAQAQVKVTPGFQVYQPGDVIIHQGDTADFVFNLSSGLAEVVVDEVTVGTITDGEIF